MSMSIDPVEPDVPDGAAQVGRPAGDAQPDGAADREAAQPDGEAAHDDAAIHDDTAAHDDEAAHEYADTDGAAAPEADEHVGPAVPADIAIPPSRPSVGGDAVSLDEPEVAGDLLPDDEPSLTPAAIAPADDVDDVPAEPASPHVPVAHAAPPGAWHTLVRALRPRGTRAQVLTAVLCGLLGFAVVAQVRLTHDTSLSTLRQSDLVEILDQATRQADELQREASALEQSRQELESGSNSRQAALDAATRSAATQGILTGRLPAEGPGIVVTLTEPDGSIRALTLLNFLEELRNSGAEAVQLNDQRLTASSYFVASTDGDGVVVDGTTLHAPYRWTVIGDADVMATALDIPGGALASVRNDGGRGSVLRKELVSVTATRSVPTPVNATPVPPKG